MQVIMPCCSARNAKTARYAGLRCHKNRHASYAYILSIPQPEHSNGEKFSSALTLGYKYSNNADIIKQFTQPANILILLLNTGLVKGAPAKLRSHSIELRTTACSLATTSVS